MLSRALETCEPASMVLVALTILSAATYCFGAVKVFLARMPVQGRGIPTAKIRASKSTSSVLPWIGHMIGYATYGHDYFSSLCASTRLPLFSIYMMNIRLIIVQPNITAQLPKMGKVFALSPLVEKLFRRSLDLGDYCCNLLDGKDEKTMRFYPEVSRLFHEEFIPRQKLQRYLADIDSSLQHKINLLEAAQVIHIEAWTFNTLVGAIGRSVWAGDAGPFADVEFLLQLRLLLLGMPRLNCPVNFFIAKKLLKARRFVRKRLGDFNFETFSSAAGPDESFLARVRAVCLRYGDEAAAREGWTDYQLLLIAGLGPNVMAASTWLLHRLLEDRVRMAAVQREVDNLVERCEGAVDLALVAEACPLLSATWLETLRFHGSFTLGRYVRHDVLLNDSGQDRNKDYLVEKGSILLAPLKPHHFDCEKWGQDADQFRPERFLKPDGKSMDEGRRRSLRVYGIFGTMCPGRFLAVHMTMALFVRLLASFDVLPLEEPYVVPNEGKDNIAGLPTPAWDVKVAVKRRAAARVELEIQFRGSIQGL